jgi:hypothetical protein
MELLVTAGVVVGMVALAVIGQLLGLVDLSDKRRSPGSGGSRGGGAVGIGDEVFHPTRHEAQLELDRQTSLPAPAPVAGDRDRDRIYEGRIRISV